MLKGTVSRDFVCVDFIHQTAPPPPTLGRFRFLPKIRGDIRQKDGSAVQEKLFDEKTNTTKPRGTVPLTDFALTHHFMKQRTKNNKNFSTKFTKAMNLHFSSNLY